MLTNMKHPTARPPDLLRGGCENTKKIQPLLHSCQQRSSIYPMSDPPPHPRQNKTCLEIACLFVTTEWAIAASEKNLLRKQSFDVPSLRPSETVILYVFHSFDSLIKMIRSILGQRVLYNQLLLVLFGFGMREMTLASLDVGSLWFTSSGFGNAMQRHLI